MLIAVFQGEKLSGGYDVEITKVIEKQDSVEATFIANTNMGVATAALTYPYHVIKIPIMNKTVNFVQTNNISLISDNSGDTFDVETSDTIKVTLYNPGDGGYEFDEPQYDKTLLELTTTDRIEADQNRVGDFGQDVWTFKALKVGLTSIKITATRPWDKNSTITEFEATVNIE